MPPFFRPVASMRSFSELPSYPRLLKIGAAASTIFRLVCSPLVINSPFSVIGDRSVLSDHTALGDLMLVETKVVSGSKKVPGNLRPVGPNSIQLFRRTE